MCTVTFLARKDGYVLGMNRDEKLTRAAGLPPARSAAGGRTLLYPSEPTGGTWIGLNNVGATLALINWYSVQTRLSENAISRGEIVKSALPADSPVAVRHSLAEIPLHQLNPFRLIGAFPETQQLTEWRWDLNRLERREHRWGNGIWISSGFDEPGAQQTRRKVFREALREKSVGTIPWLRRLHSSHGPECGPYSVCMHRNDARTVSYTEIVVSEDSTTMSYRSGTPCSNTEPYEATIARS